MKIFFIFLTLMYVNANGTGTIQILNNSAYDLSISYLSYMRDTGYEACGVTNPNSILKGTTSQFNTDGCMNRTTEVSAIRYQYSGIWSTTCPLPQSLPSQPPSYDFLITLLDADTCSTTVADDKNWTAGFKYYIANNACIYNSNKFDNTHSHCYEGCTTCLIPSVKK